MSENNKLFASNVSTSEDTSTNNQKKYEGEKFNLEEISKIVQVNGEWLFFILTTELLDNCIVLKYNISKKSFDTFIVCASC